jgi:hypothetical protein
MFVKLSEQARECRLYADHCSAKAGLLNLNFAKSTYTCSNAGLVWRAATSSQSGSSSFRR